MVAFFLKPIHLEVTSNFFSPEAYETSPVDMVEKEWLQRSKDLVLLQFIILENFNLRLISMKLRLL